MSIEDRPSFKRTRQIPGKDVPTPTDPSAPEMRARATAPGTARRHPGSGACATGRPWCRAADRAPRR